jgi:hypothetical protein
MDEARLEESLKVEALESPDIEYCVIGRVYYCLFSVHVRFSGPKTRGN